jgi:hypothetical protein
MLERRIGQEIRNFLNSDRKEALMVTGARQVGKTYIIRECAKEIYKNIVEINFVENQQAVKLFANTTGSKDILLRLSALTDVPMIPGETLVFFDEVQECPEIVTAIKFLVEDGQYRYILSGSGEKAYDRIGITADHALKLVCITGGTGVICISIDMVGILLILRCGKVAQSLNTKIAEIHVLAVYFHTACHDFF